MAERRVRELREGGIYCLSLTPYQYALQRTIVAHPDLAWLLVPSGTGRQGPQAYALHTGAIVTLEGDTGYTLDDLDFTGRYADGRGPDTPTQSDV